MERACRPRDTSIHVKIMTKLLEDIKESDLEKIKMYLQTAELLSASETEKISSTSCLWEAMNRCGVISKMQYKELTSMLNDMKMMSLYDFISALEEEYKRQSKDETPTVTRSEHDMTERQNATSQQHPYCSFCFYKRNKKVRAKRECSECDHVTLCMKCCDEHEKVTQHCMVPLSDPGDKFCQSHTDQPHKLKHTCVNCNMFICDLCLAIDHKICGNTYKLCATGRQALIHTENMAQQTEAMLSTRVEDYDAIKDEVVYSLTVIAKRSFHLIQDVLLLNNQQTTSSSRQRDDLISRVMTGLEEDMTDIISSSSRSPLVSSTVSSCLTKKLETSMVLKKYTRPEEVSMGQLYEESETYGGYANTRAPPMIPPRKTSGSTPTTPSEVGGFRDDTGLPGPTQVDERRSPEEDTEFYSEVDNWTSPGATPVETSEESACFDSINQQSTSTHPKQYYNGQFLSRLGQVIRPPPSSYMKSQSCQSRGAEVQNLRPKQPQDGKDSSDIGLPFPPAPIPTANQRPRSASSPNRVLSQPHDSKDRRSIELPVPPPPIPAGNLRSKSNISSSPKVVLSQPHDLKDRTSIELPVPPPCPLIPSPNTRSTNGRLGASDAYATPEPRKQPYEGSDLPKLGLTFPPPCPSSAAAAVCHLRMPVETSDLDMNSIKLTFDSPTTKSDIPSINPDFPHGYEIEQFSKTCWNFLPKSRYIFSFAMFSPTEYALLTSKSANARQDLADTIAVFSLNGTIKKLITEGVRNSRRLIVNHAGEMVLLQTEPACIRILHDSAADEVISIATLENPRSIEVDGNDNYYIVHGDQKAGNLTVLQSDGNIATSIEIDEGRYVNCSTAIQDRFFLYTLSRTAVSSYEWEGLRLYSKKTGEHGRPKVEIFGSCCNEYGDLFMVGGLKNTEMPREIGLYQLLEREDNWRIRRLDNGLMRCSQEPRIACQDGHILVVLKDSTKQCTAWMFKLSLKQQ